MARLQEQQQQQQHKQAPKGPAAAKGGPDAPVPNGVAAADGKAEGEQQQQARQPLTDEERRLLVKEKVMEHVRCAHTFLASPPQSRTLRFLASSALSSPGRALSTCRTHFRPEFVNRVDDFITFEPLRPDQIKQIVVLRAQRLVVRLAERRIRLQLEDSAVEHLARVGFDPVFGARPVKRALQRELQTLLAKVRGGPLWKALTSLSPSSCCIGQTRSRRGWSLWKKLRARTGWLGRDSSSPGGPVLEVVSCPVVVQGAHEEKKLSVPVGSDACTCAGGAARRV